MYFNLFHFIAPNEEFHKIKEHICIFKLKPIIIKLYKHLLCLWTHLYFETKTFRADVKLSLIFLLGKH